MEAVLDDIGYWETVAAEQEGGARDTCIPHFYMRAVQNLVVSEDSGRPVFDEIAYVRVLVPGDKNNVVDRKVGDGEKARWPRQWASFLAKRELCEGTPIAHWPYLTVARVAELKAIEVFTVEQVAGADEPLLERIGTGALDLKKRAKEFLQPQSKTETGLRSENAKLRRRIEQQEIRLSALEGENAKLRDAAQPAKRRGRK